MRALIALAILFSIPISSPVSSVNSPGAWQLYKIVIKHCYKDAGPAITNYVANCDSSMWREAPSLGEGPRCVTKLPSELYINGTLVATVEEQD